MISLLDFFSHLNRRKKEENDARYERSRSNATPSPPTSNYSTKKDNSSSWEFDWSRQKSKSTSASDSSSPQLNSEEDEVKEASEQSDSFTANFSANKAEDMFNNNSIYNHRHFECHYCFKRLTDKEDLLSHQSICKRLSSNRIKNKYYSSKPADFYPAKDFSGGNGTSATSGSAPMTECVKCKATMSTYDFLLHHCNESTKGATSANNGRSETANGTESRANLNSASSNLSSSSFKYTYRPKPSLESTHFLLLLVLSIYNLLII